MSVFSDCLRDDLTNKVAGINKSLQELMKRCSTVLDQTFQRIPFLFVPLNRPITFIKVHRDPGTTLPANIRGFWVVAQIVSIL